MKQQQFVPLLIVIAALLLAVVILGSQDKAPQKIPVPSGSNGNEAILAGPILGGGSFDLADHRGSVVLVDFWGPWCPPCRATMPNMIDIYQRYAERGLVVVGAPVNSDPQNVRDYVNAHAGMDWVQLQPAVADQAAGSFGIQGVPTIAVIDRQGNRRESVHPGNKEQLQLLVKALLDQGTDN